MKSKGHDPRQAARAAGLRYVSDERLPGIRRRGAAGHFYYVAPSGQRVRDKATLKRIRALAIPPAWTDVWIAPFANAHLMATGRDAKGRKQYRYHDGFAAVRDADKYAHLVEFASGLGQLRKRLKADLKRPGLPREKVLASVVTLLEQTLIRIGNEDYARANNSFGLTTLRNRHVKVKGSELRFLFQGKSGKQWQLAVQDPRVAKVIRSCQELPGQHLFEYRDPAGKVHAVTSSDVNQYLREVSGREISAKDFRTWAGTVAAALALRGLEGIPSKRALRQVISGVAEKLGNTISVCRKCYVHPGVITAYEEGRLTLRLPARAKNGLSPAEQAVLAYLKRRVV
jgi:DNA topoisomerase-1